MNCYVRLKPENILFYFSLDIQRNVLCKKNPLHIISLWFYISIVTWCNSNKEMANFQEKISGFMAKRNFCRLMFTVEPAKQMLTLELIYLFYILGKYLYRSWYGAQKL